MTPRDLSGLFGFAAALVILLWSVTRLARAGKVPAETARKMVHAGTGIACLAFPWIFSGPIPVAVLALLATGGLLAVRVWPRARHHLGGSLHGVARRSVGELFFPIAVAVVFALAGPRKEYFLIPVLVLTISDALGAMVGTRYGQSPYLAWKGNKSIEGSVLFFLSAFLCCHLVLLLGTSTSRAGCVWIAFSVGLLATAIEGMLGDGWDNLLVPAGTFLVLDQLDGLEVADQALVAAVFAGIMALLWFFRHWSALDGGAMLAGLLYTAACIAWGGYAYLAAPLAQFSLHLMVTRELGPRRKFHHAADAILFLALPVLAVLAWRHLGAVAAVTAFTAHTTVTMAQTAMMHASTRRALRLPKPRMLAGAGKALLFIGVPAITILPCLPLAWAILAVTAALPWLIHRVFAHAPALGPEPKNMHQQRAMLAGATAVITLAILSLVP